MKKLILIAFLPILLLSGTFAQEPADTGSDDVIDKVAGSLNQSLDSATFEAHKIDIENLQKSIDALRENYQEVKATKVNTLKDYEELYSIILALLTSLLTFFQRQGWLKNIKEPIVVVVATGAALALSVTLFKGDWNAWSFVQNWFVAAGGGVLAWEIMLKHITKFVINRRSKSA